jgi:hypothetical protein
MFINSNIYHQKLYPVWYVYILHMLLFCWDIKRLRFSSTIEHAIRCHGFLACGRLCTATAVAVLDVIQNVGWNQWELGLNQLNPKNKERLKWLKQQTCGLTKQEWGHQLFPWARPSKWGKVPRVSRSTNSRVASVATKSFGETLKNLKRHKHKQLKEWCQHSRVSRRAFQCPSAEKNWIESPVIPVICLEYLQMAQTRMCKLSYTYNYIHTSGYFTDTCMIYIYIIETMPCIYIYIIHVYIYTCVYIYTFVCIYIIIYICDAELTGLSSV